MKNRIHKITRVLAIIICLLLTSVATTVVSAQTIDPQYIFVRKNPMKCNPSDCRMLWNFSKIGGDFLTDYNLGINDILNKVGSRGTEQRKLGVGVNIFYNNYDISDIKTELPKLLQVVEEKNTPIYLALDGWKWWSKYTELWNFSDPTATGYNPANNENVEWTCDNKSCAIDKSWRNWGHEMEIEPQPNLASRKFIEQNKSKLKILIPIISEWYNNLPADKKWLLGGVNLGIEVDIGGDFYYYQNGQSTGNGIIDSIQIGYAAVDSLNLTGGVTTNNLNIIVRSYINELDKLTFDLGIPRSKIYNHIGGFDIHPNPNLPTHIVFPTTPAGLSNYGQPGWSFYGPVTNNPQNYSSLSSTLDSVSKSQWASPEWRTYASTYQDYVDALNSSLNYRNNRFINISNWEEIRDEQFVLDALKTVLEDSSSCWTSSPSVQKATLNNSTISLEWEKGSNNDSVYLNISTKGDYNQTGTLNTIDVANEQITNLTTWTKGNLDKNRYYWQLIANGCNNQRKIAEGVLTKSNPSDFNSDGLVNIFDYNILINGFGSKYDIFDYNELVNSYK